MKTWRKLMPQAQNRIWISNVRQIIWMTSKHLCTTNYAMHKGETDYVGIFLNNALWFENITYHGSFDLGAHILKFYFHVRREIQNTKSQVDSYCLLSISSFHNTAHARGDTKIPWEREQYKQQKNTDKRVLRRGKLITVCW